MGDFCFLHHLDDFSTLRHSVHSLHKEWTRGIIHLDNFRAILGNGNVPTENQLIVSGIGYESEETFGITFDNVIYLNNDKYNLLCSEDYVAYSDLLMELCSK